MSEEKNSWAIAAAMREVDIAIIDNTGRLYIKDLPITELPKTISEIKGLTTLICSNTDIKSLSFLESTKNLVTLDCSDTQIDSLAGLEHVTSLTKLNCSGTSISSLAELQHLHSLIFLDCNCTDVDRLSALRHTPHLEVLDCNSTKIDNLEALQYVPSLSSLDCSNTVISSLASLKYVPKLTQLDFTFTQVDSLVCLKYAPSLCKLRFADTHIDSLSGLIHVPSLTELDCSAYGIQELDGLAHTPFLTTLDCSDTKIQNLQGLAHVKNLISLRCVRVNIDDLEDLSYVPQLAELDCSQTNVNSLAGLVHVSKLIKLDCSSTKIDSLVGLKNVPELIMLDCSGTKIDSLMGLKHVPELDTLDCSYTCITDLVGLENNAALVSLNCSGTRISSLRELKDLPRLTNVSCDKTWLKDTLSVRRLVCLTFLTLSAEYANIASVPSEILSDDCRREIFDFFAELDTAAIPMRSAKLFILGNGKVGKTQIREWIKPRGPSDPLLVFNDEWDSTHGVETCKIAIPAPDGGTYDLDTWDFGGQEMYHGTHALFLKQRAIFLIAWTPTMETGTTIDGFGHESQNHPLAYWLDYATQFGGADSRIIIAQTQCDTGKEKQAVILPANMDVSRVEILDISAKTNRRKATLMDALSEATQHVIDAAMLPALPTSWVQIGDQLRARDSERTISMADYRALCVENNLTQGQDTLLQWLNATGVLFYREGLFGDQIILDQTWALDAIYALYRRDGAEPMLKAQAGRFVATDLADWYWTSAGHSEEDQQLLLSFMLQAGMCFVHRDGNDWGNQSYIAPDFLPKIMPNAARAAWIDDAPVLTRTWQFDLLHDGIFRAIVSALGKTAKDYADYWCDGVQLFDSETQCRARITGDRRDGAWDGSVTLTVQTGRLTRAPDQEIRLLKFLEYLIDGCLENIGANVAKASMVDASDVISKPRQTEEPFDDASDFGEPAANQQFKPGYDPRTPPKFYVSYAWSDDKNPNLNDPVDAFIARANEGRAPHQPLVIRDKEALAKGDNFRDFMGELSRTGRKIVCFISKKYLESPNCGFELASVYESCKSKRHKFTDVVEVHWIDWNPCNDKTWVGPLIDKWVAKYDAMCPKVEGRRLTLVEHKISTDYALIRENFVAALQELQNSNLPQGPFDDFCEKVIAELKLLMAKSNQG
jgi:internalin A